MQETEFQFAFRQTEQGSIDALQAELEKLPDVLSCATERSAHRTTMTLRVQFENAKHAKQFHRRITAIIIAAPGATLAEVTTRPTDIF